jgi:putative hydrolase of the HAD superfamily
MALLLCDLDETLVDRSAAFRRWAAELASDRGLDAQVVEWLVVEDRGGMRPREELFALVKDRLGWSEPLSELIDGFNGRFPTHFHCHVEVRAALTRARQAGWSIAIVTNGGPIQADKIAHADLAPLVDAVCISSVDGFAKPDRRLLDLAATRCRSSLEGAWLIGDNPDTDIAAAHHAGINSAWLTLDRQWDRTEFGPTVIAETFPSAVTTILTLNEVG